MNLSLIRWTVIILLAISPWFRGMVDIVSIGIFELVVLTCLLMLLISALGNKIHLKFSKLDLPFILIFLLGIVSVFFSIYPAGSKRELFFMFCSISFFL